MSLYNILYGENPAVYYILPMIGSAKEDFPRFRDCFVGKLTNGTVLADSERSLTDDEVITVFARVGGANRNDYEQQIEEIREHPHYLEDVDDTFDSTYASFIFKVPDEWIEDFRLLVNDNNWQDTSQEYRTLIEQSYPDYIDLMMWNRTDES